MIHIFPLNQSDIVVRSDRPDWLRMIQTIFKVVVPEHKYIVRHNPSMKGWDGTIQLFRPSKKHAGLVGPRGLVHAIINLANVYNWNLNIDQDLLPRNINEQEVDDFFMDMDLPFEFRDYQIKSIYDALRLTRCVLVSPTGSGKSFIMYGLNSWLKARENIQRTLIIVPNNTLVTQLKSDFEFYGSSEVITTSLGLGDVGDTHITTWQTLFHKKKDLKKFLMQFDAVFGDEAHTTQAKVLKNIFSDMTHISWRIGTTGTLQDEILKSMTVIGIFGPIIQHTSTSQMIDRGLMPDLKIYLVPFYYPTQSMIRDWRDEVDLLINNHKRNTIIINLIKIAQQGTSLILFQHIAHGQQLLALARQNYPDYNIYYIDGSIDSIERERIRNELNNDDLGKSILIASVGTVAVGVNIPSLTNLIFASPTKSRIRVLQSLGRIMRKTDTKHRVNVYDVVDMFRTRKNYAARHAQQRVEIYQSENFAVTSLPEVCI